MADEQPKEGILSADALNDAIRLKPGAYVAIDGDIYVILDNSKRDEDGSYQIHLREQDRPAGADILLNLYTMKDDAT